jgi:hypothetical protein
VFADRLGGGRVRATVPWHGACRFDECRCRPESLVWLQAAFIRRQSAASCSEPATLASFACEGKWLRVTEPDAWLKAEQIAAEVTNGKT